MRWRCIVAATVEARFPATGRARWANTPRPRSTARADNSRVEQRGGDPQGGGPRQRPVTHGDARYAFGREDKRVAPTAGDVVDPRAEQGETDPDHDHCGAMPASLHGPPGRHHRQLAGAAPRRYDHHRERDHDSGQARRRPSRQGRMLCRRRSRDRGSEPRRRPARSRQRRRSRLPRLPLPRRSGPAAMCSRRAPGAALVRAGVSPRARRRARQPARTRYTRRAARGTGTEPARTTRRCGPRRARQRGCRRRRPTRRATTSRWCAAPCTASRAPAGSDGNRRSKRACT